MEDHLVTEYIQKLLDKEKEITEFTLQHVNLDTYPQNVGYLQGLKYAKEEFLQLLKAYFPT